MNFPIHFAKQRSINKNVNVMSRKIHSPLTLNSFLLDALSSSKTQKRALLLQKWGWRWALTSFAAEVWGATEEEITK
jgi:hypothetical protein